MQFLIILLIFLCTHIVSAQNNLEIQTKTRLAESYLNAGDLKKAAELYQELIRLVPANNFYFESLNRIYIQTKNYAASVNLIESVIKRRPEEINLYGLLGSTYYMMGNEEKAFSVWEESLQYASGNALSYRIIAAYAVERRAFEKAIDIYKRGKEFSNDQIIFSFDLARLYSLTMQYRKSTEEYCSILKLDPSLLPKVETKILADAQKPDALQAAISVVEEYLDDENLSISYLLARLSTANKDFDKAYELYAEIDKQRKNNGAELFRYASYLYREGEYDVAKDVYQSIINLFPDSSLIPASQLGYAKTLEALLMQEYSKQIPIWKPYFNAKPFYSEQVNKVITAFSDVIDMYKRSETTSEAMLRIGMINLYLLKDFKNAEDYFNKVLKQGILTSSMAGAYEGLGELSLIGGDLTGAEKNYLQITVFVKADQHIRNNAKFKLARISLFQGKIEQSRKLLSEILTNLKDNSANDALELSLLLNTSRNDSANLKIFAEAEFLTEQKKYFEAAEKYNQLAQTPHAFIFHSIASLRLAGMYLALDNYDESIKCLNEIVAEGEKNIYADKALYLLAELFQYGIGDNIKAIEMYEELLAKFPSSIYIDEARAQILKLRDKIS
ncbi:MAG: tetratricopeptide repeat protein [Ignavibacteria bacterium]|jgi:tetratricopeptide (TPR) repeat protein